MTFPGKQNYRTEHLRISGRFSKVMNADKSHLLASQTPPWTQGEWLTGLPYVFAVSIQPTFWNEVVWIVEICRIVCYCPGASIALGLALQLAGNLKTQGRTGKVITPLGTQYPSTIAPGDVLGNPCGPGGYILKPSLMTAWRYGSCNADAALIS